MTERYYESMAMRAVPFVKDAYYHIYNRGSEKRTLFLVASDYEKFLLRLKENAAKMDIKIVAFCLMPNHYHLLLQQGGTISIATMMQAIQISYAKYFNAKYTRVGPLFQGRFKAKLIDSDSYLLEASAYIHRNPIGILKQKYNMDLAKAMLHSYPYSSYASYCSPTPHSFVTKEKIIGLLIHTDPVTAYKEYVTQRESLSEELIPILVDCQDDTF